jgi:nucleoside-diphosphate-sugar epimerase
VRVLVTGHLGYLGTVLTGQLAEAGHEPIGLDVGWFGDCLLGPAPAPIESVALDLRDVTREHLRDLRVDAVMHLAALCNDPLGNLNPELTYDVNFHSTVRLAAAAKAAGVTRFLFSSSCSLYGAGTEAGPLAEAVPLTETAGFQPVTPYGESKILAEQGLSGLASDDFSPTYLRNATAYGFSPRLRGDIVVNDLVGHALLTGEVRLQSDGSAWRPLIHAEDIGRAFLALLEAPRERVHDRAFNVAQTGENYLIRDVATAVQEIVGGELTFAPGSGVDLRNYRVSGDLIAAEIPGFRPTWTVRKGIEQLAEAYQRHGLTFDNLTGPRHQRLKRISSLHAEGRLDGDLRWVG